MPSEPCAGSRQLMARASRKSAGAARAGGAGSPEAAEPQKHVAGSSCPYPLSTGGTAGAAQMPAASLPRLSQRTAALRGGASDRRPLLIQRLSVKLPRSPGLPAAVSLCRARSRHASEWSGSDLKPAKCCLRRLRPISAGARTAAIMANGCASPSTWERIRNSLFRCLGFARMRTSPAQAPADIGSLNSHAAIMARRSMPAPECRWSNRPWAFSTR